MRGTRTVLILVLLNLVLITGPSARAADDECLAKPNGPTPRGQHWYYRIDHANDGRQCWYLRAESARAPNDSRQAKTDPTEAMAQSIQAPALRAGSREAPTGETARERSPAAAAAPIPWLNVQKFPAPIPFPQSVTQQKPTAPTQADGATATTASESAPEAVIDSPAARPGPPAPNAGSNSAPVPRAREPQRRQQMQVRPEPPAPAIAQVDHTFALLMTVLAALAIAGPALHFVERRRRRKAVSFRPPPWARVVALNSPKPGIRVMSRRKIANPPVPVPVRPPDRTEKLAHALQQLADRLQAGEKPEPNAMHIRPRGRASM